MATKSTTTDSTAEYQPPKLRSKKACAAAEEPYVHIYHHGAVCETDKRGHANPENRGPLDLVLDATEGFIPLWAENVTLRWRFQERSMALFRNPDAARAYLGNLMAEALLLWGDAVPVRFFEARDAWDFEVAVSPVENCTANGCVLASAFFPDGGQHELKVYPTLFEQTRDEQVETMAHEFGHIFGLRHFFAQITETQWASVLFGEHQPFSIMNYGPQSEMTQNDRDDLKELYRLVRSFELTEINGTPVRLVQPFSALRIPPELAFA
ncbi:MAG: reprolysin-like metallopeptidase [Pseudomonadota bacterium]